MSIPIPADLITHARQQSFTAGLRAGDYAIRAQLTAARDEIHQLRIANALLRDALDNARGELAKWRPDGSAD